MAFRLARRETVKLGRAQLKVQGSWTRGGVAAAIASVLLGLLLLHSGFIRTNEWLGGRAFDRRAPNSPASADLALDYLEAVDRWGLANTSSVDRMLATLHLESTAAARAEPFLRRRLERYPEDHHSRLHLARALFDADRVSEAEAEVEVVLAGGGASADLRAESYNLLGGFRASRGELKGAIQAYEAALEAAPNDPAAYRALGELFSALQRYEDAVKHLSTAIELDPAFAPAQYNLAVLLAQLGRDQGAIERYRVAAELAPSDPEVWNNLGFLLAKHAELAEAEGCFRRAIELDDSFAHPHFNLGRVLFRQGREAEAKPELLRAAELDSRYAEVLGG